MNWLLFWRGSAFRRASPSQMQSNSFIICGVTLTKALRECDTDLYKFLNNRAESEANIFTVFSKLMAVGQKDMFDNSFAAKNNPTLVELMVTGKVVVWEVSFKLLETETKNIESRDLQCSN